MPCFSELLISEVASGTPSDWVELRFLSNKKESVNISPLYVTMYYGRNEALSEYPITLYSYDRPETPYDDRFAVVHLTEPAMSDETDLTGDTSRNGVIDIYCNNYSASLWNGECCVALDNNDDPADGMLDFVCWADGEGDPSEAIGGYVLQAVAHGRWNGASIYDRTLSVKVPKGGLQPSQSICRFGYADTNCRENFALSDFQTPGKENIIGGSDGRSLFVLDRKKITAVPGNSQHPARCNLSVSIQCSLRLKVFSDTGQLVWRSDLLPDIPPGRFFIDWPCNEAHTGLYIAVIEGSAGQKKNQSEKFFFIVTRYK
jgi:hypothetical protein